MYGEAGLVVGAAIQHRREEVLLVDKVLPENAFAKGTTLVCQRSLLRLETDRLDCYLLHCTLRRTPAPVTTADLT
jgi:diketogulonate reductase-like aldo/keto reductase